MLPDFMKSCMDKAPVFFYDVLHHNALFALEMWTRLTTSRVKFFHRA